MSLSALKYSFRLVIDEQWNNRDMRNKVTFRIGVDSRMFIEHLLHARHCARRRSKQSRYERGLNKTLKRDR